MKTTHTRNCRYQVEVKNEFGIKTIQCVNLDHQGELCGESGTEKDCGFYEPYTPGEE